MKYRRDNRLNSFFVSFVSLWFNPIPGILRNYPNHFVQIWIRCAKLSGGVLHLIN